jgi:hypothetical protein
VSGNGADLGGVLAYFVERIDVDDSQLFILTNLPPL